MSKNTMNAYLLKSLVLLYEKRVFVTYDKVRLKPASACADPEGGGRGLETL